MPCNNLVNNLIDYVNFLRIVYSQAYYSPFVKHFVILKFFKLQYWNKIVLLFGIQLKEILK